MVDFSSSFHFFPNLFQEHPPKKKESKFGTNSSAMEFETFLLVGNICGWSFKKKLSGLTIVTSDLLFHPGE